MSKRKRAARKKYPLHYAKKEHRYLLSAVELDMAKRSRKKGAKELREKLDIEHRKANVELALYENKMSKLFGGVA